MVNADAAPALPWGQSNEGDAVQQTETNDPRMPDSPTTAEPEHDHNSTSQIEGTGPSAGTRIEVHTKHRSSLTFASMLHQSVWKVALISIAAPEHRLGGK